jgi:UDPglucose 6-dehydrogenase
MSELLKHQVYLRVYDPAAVSKAKEKVSSPLITWCRDEYHAAENCDAIALLTEWKQFRVVDFPIILKQMKGKVFFDGRNQYRKSDMVSYGFDYFGMGIPHE